MGPKTCLALYDGRRLRKNYVPPASSSPSVAVRTHLGAQCQYIVCSAGWRWLDRAYASGGSALGVGLILMKSFEEEGCYSIVPPAINRTNTPLKQLSPGFVLSAPRVLGVSCGIRSLSQRCYLVAVSPICSFTATLDFCCFLCVRVPNGPWPPPPLAAYV